MNHIICSMPKRFCCLRVLPTNWIALIKLRALSLQARLQATSPYYWFPRAKLSKCILIFRLVWRFCFCISFWSNLTIQRCSAADLSIFRLVYQASAPFQEALKLMRWLSNIWMPTHGCRLKLEWQSKTSKCILLDVVSTTVSGFWIGNCDAKILCVQHNRWIEKKYQEAHCCWSAEWLQNVLEGGMRSLYDRIEISIKLGQCFWTQTGLVSRRPFFDGCWRRKAVEVRHHWLPPHASQGKHPRASSNCLRTKKEIAALEILFK